MCEAIYIVESDSISEREGGETDGGVESEGNVGWE